MGYIIIILGSILYILGLILLILCAYFTFPHNRQKNHQNKVHFYVARDKNKTLWLYIGKPIRKEESGAFAPKIHGFTISNSLRFEYFGLNIDDYKDLKWEDEPVEVFLNFED